MDGDRSLVFSARAHTADKAGQPSLSCHRLTHRALTWSMAEGPTTETNSGIGIQIPTQHP